MNASPGVRALAPKCSSPTRWLLAATLSLIAACPVRADSVTDWNALASGPLVVPRFGGPQQQARALAIVQIAVHDALNSIDHRYDTYTVLPSATASASADAAVAAATRRALLAQLNLLPPSADVANAISAVNSAFDAALGPQPYDAAEIAGIASGEAAANAILALRNNDGSATPHLPFTLAPAPGVYQPTPAPEFPAQITPSFAGWAFVTPFALRSGSQFRSDPGEIFDLTGERYTREYNEVRLLGDARIRGAQPDSDATRIARFWPGGGADWNANARIIVDGLGLDRWQHARLLALMNMSLADALIANQDSKYHYVFWRPVTAIRWADDGNPDTPSDATWRPLLQTPPYPDYPCALPTAVAANTSVLRKFLGTDDVAFTRLVNAPPAPLPAPMAALPAAAIERHYDSLSQAEDEAARARVYAGIHFLEGCRAGVRMGNQVGRFVFQHYLRPVK